MTDTGRWFSPGTPVSSTNKTNRHDITEILWKVALNTINQATLTHGDHGQFNVIVRSCVPSLSMVVKISVTKNTNRHDKQR